jgi:hypothetical protein
VDASLVYPDRIWCPNCKHMMGFILIVDQDMNDTNMRACWLCGTVIWTDVDLLPKKKNKPAPAQAIKQ